LNISCIVLAGGKGLRLGRDKTVEAVGNTSLLERVVSNLSLFNSDIIIVTAVKQFLPQFIDYPKLRLVADIYPGKGALGGIYTGLATSDSLYNLVVACDMPFLNQGLLHYMVQIADGFDLVMPRLDNLVEPLHAVYSKGCLTPMENLLKQGNLKLDPKHLSFFNINTETDLETARELAKEGDTIIAKR